MADEMKATPVKNKQAAGVAGALQGLHSFVSKPFGYDNPPGQMLSQFVGIPDIASALERIGYGEPLTTGSGQTLKLRDDVLNAIMAVAPFAQATKGLPVGAATKSPIAIAELEKLAKIKAEMAAKNAADEALKPQYNEAVKGMTQKQDPLSFEQWKAINYPEGTQGLQNAPQKQTFKYPQESLPAAERDANLAKFLEQSKIKQRMFHGTGSDIDNFYPGTFLSFEPKSAASYAKDRGYEQGANVMPVYAQAKKVATENDVLQAAKELGFSDETMPAFMYLSPNISKESEKIYPSIIQNLKQKGFDSAKIFDWDMDQNEIESLHMFSPKQIKSAIGNRGTYDINEADINKAAGGAVFNTDPDMSDGGQIFQGPPFKHGGDVNLDAMYMAVNDAKFRRK